MILRALLSAVSPTSGYDIARATRLDVMMLAPALATLERGGFIGSAFEDKKAGDKARRRLYALTLKGQFAAQEPEP